MNKILTRYKKELLVLLGTVFVVLALSTYFLHNQVTQSLVTEHSNKLNSLKNALKVHVEHYFELTRHIVQTLSTSETTLLAMEQFGDTLKQDQERQDVSSDRDRLVQSMNQFLAKVSYDVPQAQPRRQPEDYLPKSHVGRILQEYYVARNPFDEANRGRYFRGNSSLGYDKTHEQFHSYFLTELENYQFYDLFLIDPSGFVIYTVNKEFDFATNIRNGPYASSGLATVFSRALHSQENEVIFEDFKPYEPSYNKPAAFVATPLYRGNTKIGVLAIQLPVTKLVQIMSFNRSQESMGLGESGESYLVGDDMFMRSDSRFIKTMQDPLVQKFSTTVGITTVRTEATAQALNGITSNGLIADYRGIDVYSSYAPIQVFDKTWAILVEIDKAEVLASVEKSTRTQLMTSILIFTIFVLIVVLLFARMILGPMQDNEELLSKNLRLQNKALMSSEKLLSEYKKAVDSSAIVSKANMHGIITFVNDAFCKSSGYDRSELIGKSHNINRHPDTPKEVFEDLWHTILNKEVWKGVIKNRRKDGSAYYVDTSIVPILDANDEIYEFISLRRDVTDLIHKEEQIRRQTTDRVTGLPNKQQLFEDISKLAAKAELASVMVNNFRDIVDFYGPAIADGVARGIASVFRHIIISDAICLYRVSQDEFAMLNREYMPMAEFEKIIHGLISYFDHNVLTVEDLNFNISLTVGASSSIKEKLFVSSEMALRKTMENSQSLFSLKDDSLVDQQYQTNIALTTQIKNAIKHDDIAVFAQRIASNNNAAEEKYECLIRMRTRSGWLSPSQFLGAAKKARLYPTLTKILIEKSFAYFSKNSAEFSINLTLEDILNEEVVLLLKRKLREYQIGNRVVIELVESEGIEEYEAIHEFIAVAKSLGCKIAIDDFGTGYSNFEYLMKLNADYIKIDGSLIRNIHTDMAAQVVVQLIVDFANRMGIKVIAEYVHNAQVQRKIEELGIEYSQGYFIDKPQELVERPTKQEKSSLRPEVPVNGESDSIWANS